MIRPGFLIALLLIAPSGIVIAMQQQSGSRNGPTGVFISEVPEYDLSIVQGNPTPTSVTLSLMAPKDLDVTLKLPSKVEKLSLKAFVPSEVQVSGLTPGSNSPYSADFADGSISGSLITAKPKGKSFTFAIQADSHLDENSTSTMYQRTLGNMAKDKPDFLIDLGDTFMTGKHAKFEDSIKQYRAQRYYFGRLAPSAPLFMVLGNHDGEQGWTERAKDGMTSWSSKQRKSHFPEPELSSTYTGNTEKGNYYEFSWGDSQCWILDPYSFTKQKPAQLGSNWGWTLGEAQYKWLKASLGKSKAKYRFVFIHHLVGGLGRDSRGGAEASQYFEWGGKGSDGKNVFEEKRPGWGLPIHDLLKKNEVDVVFHGHDHLFVKQERDGIVYQEVPQPSHGRGDSTRSAEEYSYKSGIILGSSGYLRVKVEAENAVVDYVKTSSAATTGTIAATYDLKP
jgi:predicted phosphodiesterase